MKRKFNLTIVQLFFVFLLCSCSRSYTTISFSYPPNSEPHENNWAYIGQILTWDPLGNKSTEKGKRKIEIKIKDKNNKNVLHDTFELECASVDRNIHWEKFENLNIELFEKGNQFATDEYNERLIKEGPMHLLTLNYIWNGNGFIKKTPNKAMNSD